MFLVLVYCLTIINLHFFCITLDEQALVIGSQQFGFKFHTRCPTSVTITTLYGEETYEILSIIEFTNHRKRMSVIVRTADGQIKLFCKVLSITININKFIIFCHACTESFVFDHG